MNARTTPFKGSLEDTSKAGKLQQTSVEGAMVVKIKCFLGMDGFRLGWF